MALGMLYFFGSLIGVSIGSFMNVVLDRILLRPTPQSIWGRSCCTSCHHVIRWMDNIPIVSYLRLRGQCRDCRDRIPLRFLGLEIFGLFFGILMMHFYQTGFISWPSFLGSLMLWIVLALLFISDYEQGVLPDRLQIPLMVAGLIWAALGQGLSLWSSILGLAGGWGGVQLMNLGYRSIRGHEGIGQGDAKMMAWLGCFFGLPSVIGIFFLGALGGSLWAMILKFKGQYHPQVILPFGCFLSIATLIVFYWGDILWTSYLRLGVG